MIASALELDRVLTRVVEAAVFITKAEEGALMLLDEQTNELYVRAQRGLGEKDAHILSSKVESSDGIVGAVAREGMPKRLETDRGIKLATGFTVKSVLCLPLILRSEVIGVLSVDNRTPGRRFTEGDERLLSVLADYAAIAIKNAKLLKESERRARAFSGLHAVSQSLLSVHDLQEVLGTVAENALSVLGADLVILYEYIKEKDDVRTPPVFRGDAKEPKILHKRGDVVPGKESVVFKMLRRDEPFYAPNAREDWVRAGFFASPWDERGGSFISQEDIVSSAGIPLLMDGEAVGVLFINYRDFHQFTPNHKERIEIFANQAALAIDKAKEVYRSKKIAETLQEVMPDVVGLSGEGIFGDLWTKINETIARMMPNTNLCLYVCDDADPHIARRMECSSEVLGSHLKPTWRVGEDPFKPGVSVDTEACLLVEARSTQGQLEGFLILERIPAREGVMERFDEIDRLVLTTLASAVGNALFQQRRQRYVQPGSNDTERSGQLPSLDS